MMAQASAPLAYCPKHYFLNRRGLPREAPPKPKHCPPIFPAQQPPRRPRSQAQRNSAAWHTPSCLSPSTLPVAYLSHVFTPEQHAHNRPAKRRLTRLQSLACVNLLPVYGAAPHRNSISASEHHVCPAGRSAHGPCRAPPGSPITRQCAANKCRTATQRGMGCPKT